MTPTPAHITTHGLGPHAQPVTVTLAPGGTTITAPSQAGKSRATVHALCLALTGRAPDAGAVDLRDITDGVDRAIARYLGPARGDGAVYGVRAELRASGTASAALTVLSMTRDAQGKAQVQTVAGPAGQAEHLAALGMSGPIIRAIIVPGAAAGLATGTPDGRGLRDVLAEVLPAQDLGAEVQSRLTAQGLALKPDDPLTLGKTAATKGSALAAQAAANKAAAQADGAATALAAAAARAREAREAVRGSAPDLERVRKAEAWLSVYTEWQAYDDALTKHAQAVAAHTAAAEALVAWQARRGALGPAPSTADVQAAEAALAAAKASKAEADAAVVELRLARTAALRTPVPGAADVDRAQRAVADLTGRLAQAKGKAAALAQGRGTDDAPRHTCPTCGQAISDAEGRRQDALALAAAGDVAGLETMLGDAQRELEAARAARDEQAAAVRAQHDAAVAEAERVAEVAAVARAEAATALAVARQGPDAHAAAVRALGPAPALPTTRAPEAAPVAPSSPRPDPRHLEAARALVEQARDHARAVTHAEVTAADAGAAERAAAGTAQTAAREAERVEALVRALREAPGEMLRRSRALVAQALQGTGVEVVMAQDGDALALTIDGRPWAQASTGRQTLADYQLRVALRALAHARHPGLPFLKYADLPVIVDNAQSWSGSWPAAAHPAALLVTGAGQGAGLRAGPWPGA
jgi:hypothetical protein